MNINIQVKKTLEDIIDNAYPSISEFTKKKYKSFFLSILSIEKKSSSGQYIIKNKKIEVYNLGKGSKMIVKCCLHELAHHIDYCNRGTSDHQTAFYEVYRTLIYTAMNMRIITPEQMSSDMTSQDGNKVRKIVAAWIPAFISYKSAAYIIKVENGYERRYELKSRGYTWNSLESVWNKEVEEDECNVEEAYLYESKLSYQKSLAADLNINAVGYIIQSTDSYKFKDALKGEGFHYKVQGRKRFWYKKIKLAETKKIINELKVNPLLADAVFEVKSNL